MKVIYSLRYLGAFFIFILNCSSSFAASGLFPKMLATNEVNVINCGGDSENARITAWALAGLVNQSRVEAYIITRAVDQEQLNDSGLIQNKVPMLGGVDPGLRTLFGKFSERVKKMFVYDPAKDWTFCLALMAASQHDGIPVTESIRASLSSEFDWRGEVEDFRNKGSNRIEGYDWALDQLMPGCTRKVVFILARNASLVDYVVASKGFIFWLDLKKPDEQAEADKIFSTQGYTVGTSLMGYANSGDEANVIANKHGIGYVVSNYYENGSFWSSFPNKTYHQAAGNPSDAVAGKIYVAIGWSDGDNIQFDQNGTYELWHDPARGRVPVATTLSPTLQELNTPLLDWYYSKMTVNDELIAGPSGVQFIYGRDYNDDLFPAWCDLNKVWLADAGFHSACVWVTPYPGKKYATYIQTCGLVGIFHNSNSIHLRYETGLPIVDEGTASWTEQELYNYLSKQTPKEGAPVFISSKCIIEGFLKGGDGGYTKIKRVVDRLNAAYPDRYVFMLPKDFFATIRSYYHLSPAPSSL